MSAATSCASGEIQLPWRILKWLFRALPKPTSVAPSSSSWWRRPCARFRKRSERLWRCAISKVSRPARWRKSWALRKRRWVADFGRADEDQKDAAEAIMTCREYEPLIALYVEGDLNDRDVERHLAECSDCRELLEDLKVSQAALKEL